MSDREQAISELAETVPHSIGAIEEHLKRSAKFNGVYEFAVSQRERVIQLERDNQAKAERVIALERALQLIEHKSDQMLQGQYSMKILGGLILATARAALNGDSK